MKTQASSATLRDRVSEDMPRIRAELETLVRIPSISHPGHDPSQLGRSAEATAKILGDVGCETKIVEIEGVPAVIGHVSAPAGAPTVLLYAHHDVQPTGGRDLWHSDPFEPIEKNGRLYGRGSSDDKCGIVMHAGALRAHDSRPPIGVTVFVEGEEEWGSPNLGKFLERYGDELRADAVILADSGNWRTGQPGLTTSLRGIVAADIEVRTLDHAVHSGEFGGPVPDALTVLAKTLATLHDDRGNVAVAGIARGKADPLDLEEAELRKQVGLRPTTKLIGEGYHRPDVDEAVDLDTRDRRAEAHRIHEPARAIGEGTRLDAHPARSGRRRRAQGARRSSSDPCAMGGGGVDHAARVRQAVQARRPGCRV